MAKSSNYHNCAHRLNVLYHMAGPVRYNPVLSVLDRRIQTPSNRLQIAVGLCHTNDQYAAITNRLASYYNLRPSSTL
jgi:hypothetical protein